MLLQARIGQLHAFCSNNRQWSVHEVLRAAVDPALLGAFDSRHERSLRRARDARRRFSKVHELMTCNEFVESIPGSWREWAQAEEHSIATAPWERLQSRWQFRAARHRG